MNKVNGKPGKLSAFTMIELVVAMMISAIVISIAFYAWTLISSQLVKRQARSAAITEYTLFQRALVRDMDNAQRISDSAGSSLFLLDIDGHKVRYAIGADRILRDLDGLTDTFRLAARVIKRSYLYDSLPLLSNLQLEITVNGEALLIPLQKEYTVADQLRAQKERNE
jgi:prepilin-type N-terminal cleavage/methylation domain-containing protein